MSNVEQILESIEKLTLLEAAELVKAMEEKFGVSAAAPVAVAAAKVLAKFIKENKKGEITGAVLEGKVLSADEAKKLASMPSKEELYAKILGSINSPASGLVYGVNGVMAALTRAVAAVRDQKTA